MYIYMYIHIYMYMYIYMYAYVCLYVCVYVYLLVTEEVSGLSIVGYVIPGQHFASWGPHRYQPWLGQEVSAH